MRARLHCGLLLERAGWRLDRPQSTRGALKYRRGGGEILIVNHGGRGWWDPGDARAKGDVFALAQRLDPSLTFGHVRRLLRPLVGLPPEGLAALASARRGGGGAEGRGRGGDDGGGGRPPPEPPARVWARQQRLGEVGASARAGLYLRRERRLPAAVLRACRAQDAVRAGRHGSAWFAHRGAPGGPVTHVECRGPRFRMALEGGAKTLFLLRGVAPANPLAPLPPPARLAVAEAPIDALSLAALEGLRADTLYAATGGGVGPGTERALLALLRAPGLALLLAASDADAPGERHAARLAELAAATPTPCARLAPPRAGGDWNDALRAAADAADGDDDGDDDDDEEGEGRAARGGGAPPAAESPP